MCSPSAGHCCEQDCTFSDSSKVCNPPTECRNESFCTGDNATCPQGAPVANMTGCNNNTQVCVSGECEGSVCLMYGLSECTLSGSAYSIDQKCLVTCIHDGKCKPTCEIPEMKALCGLRMQPGATCDETRGYCDVFRKCRHVDEKGPLARLEEALFGGGVIKSLKAYILEHPFWSFVFFLLFVLVMVVFFRCFSQHTPSNNPHKPHRKWRK
ncbi:disintegrin and metalloproteinase domain-containing protein 10 homolog [Haemaphysalis longicornis]